MLLSRAERKQTSVHQINLTEDTACYVATLKSLQAVHTQTLKKQMFPFPLNSTLGNDGAEHLRTFKDRQCRNSSCYRACWDVVGLFWESISQSHVPSVFFLYFDEITTMLYILYWCIKYLKEWLQIRTIAFHLRSSTNSIFICFKSLQNASCDELSHYLIPF